MNEHPNLKVGDYVTWSRGDRSQCAMVTWISESRTTLTVQVGERAFELLYFDQVDTIAPDLSGVTLDWSK